VNVPETAFVAGAGVTTGACVAAGVCAAGVCDCVALTAAALVAAELFVELFFVAVAAALFVAAAVADGVTLCVAAGVDAAGAAPPPGNAIGDDCVEVNVGGVTAKTAPNPPTVPVAINNARFISVPSLTYL
jgi:hypothetical protein